MIRTKKELHFYIKADRMMNRGYFVPTFLQRIKEFLFPDYIMRYLLEMRKYSYYSHMGGVKYCVLIAYYKIWYKRLGMKLGFSIGQNVFGYGLVIPHYGTIVIGGSNHCGNYCVLHTSTCISDNGKTIGDALYLATGAKITSQCILGNNILVGANSVVNKSFENDNIMIAGAPAKVIKDASPWYFPEGSIYASRVEKVEMLRKQLRTLS